MSRRSTCILASLALAVSGACSEPESDVGGGRTGERWRPVHRLAESTPGTTSEGGAATATIDDETRPALRSHESFTLNYSPKYAVPSSGQVTLRPPIPASVLGEERLLVEVRVRPEDRWRVLPGQVVESYIARGKQRVDIALDFNALGLPEAAGRTIGIWATARVPQRGEETIERGPLLVPPRARLDFAVGVAGAARAQGPVDFEIVACQPGGEPGCTRLFEERVDPAEPAHQGFRERRVPLDALAGREVSLRFITRARGPGSGAEEVGDSLPFWGDPTILESVSRDVGEREAPNLILLSLDTLRADHVSAYGYARATTPFIDERLAGGGTLFEHYVAAASSTRPSHMTMFTSLPPSVHGATENAGIRTLPPGAVTLAERLRAGGFATAAVTENGAIDRSRGFGRGFGVYRENRDAKSADMRTGQIEQTFAEGLAWLDRRPGERFFLFLHTYQVHNPFTPPPEYGELFADDGVDSGAPTRPDWDPLLYDREIRYADDQVRAFVGALEARGVLQNTLLVVTSDHGEAFFEHGFVAHGANVHREVLNVPLIFVGPGVPAGRRVAAPIPMIDLMPTLLELMGVAPGGQEMGRSQASIVRGAAATEEVGLRTIFGEAWATRAVRARGHETIEQPTLSVERDGRKLIRAPFEEGFRYELYDVRADPAEESDLYSRNPSQAAELRGILEQYAERTAALHEALGEMESKRVPELDPVLEDKLRALGYID